MRSTLIACLMLLAPAVAQAQTTPKWSLGGTLFGVTYLTETQVADAGLPGGGPLLFAGQSAVRAAPEVYVGFFPHPNLIVAPGLAFAYSNPDGAESTYGLGLDLGIDWHFSGVTKTSLYITVNGAFLAWDLGADSAQTDFAAGAALGYRMLPYDFFGLRLEAAYRRYFDLRENQISCVLKAEVVFN
jgi:hypothetical protein